ncbi:sugar transferase [bacterium]|nr:sugar transferase [bacterium]
MEADVGVGIAPLPAAQVEQILSSHRSFLRFKRIFDVYNSLVQLVLFSPLFLVFALAIKLYDRGPVLFSQERLTKGRTGPRIFRILKFRTMVVGAEKLGAQITERRDPRITPVGRVLRSLKLDELPQLLNILRGEMSFVGPRPQTLGYVEAFKGHYSQIHSVVPAGLTDLASLKYREEGRMLSEADDPERYYLEKIMPDKIRCHYLYLERMNLATDLGILMHTILRVFVVKPFSRLARRSNRG